MCSLFRYFKIRNDFCIRHIVKVNYSKKNAVDILKEEEQSNKENISLLDVAKSFKADFLELPRFNHSSFSEWSEYVKEEMDIKNQTFLKDRYDLLGPDISAATFIVFRGGKVKFFNIDKWIQKEEDDHECSDLPKLKVDGYFLEAIDASNTDIRYEGLGNFVDLRHLKWLSFKNCLHVDDWFVDKISGEFCDTLEYLDLSECKNMTQASLSCMYRFKKLKTLVLNGVINDKSFEFMCLLLEDCLPDLTVVGFKNDTFQVS